MYLLVRPKKKPDEWVFPKGRIESGERNIEAAAREVEEEAGIQAKKVSVVGVSQFTNGKKPIRSVFYLMKFVAKGEAQEDRGMRWAPFAKAVKLLTHDGNRKLLKAAEKKRRKRKS